MPAKMFASSLLDSFAVILPTIENGEPSLKVTPLPKRGYLIDINT
ncbi:hypothetical protein [Shewanella woodyi]|nr:hypothetical protein [Shewanella woodyi]